MSTLPNRKLVVSRACALSLSKSSSKEAPACANTSPSPVQSMTTGAVSAKRPCLLSKITPSTRLPLVIVATTQQCMSVWTFDSRTMSLVTSLSTSGSTVGDQCTMSRSAAVRTRQYAAWTGSVDPHSSGSGPIVASGPQRSTNSAPTPATTSCPSQSLIRSIQDTSPPVDRPPRWLYRSTSTTSAPKRPAATAAAVPAG